MALTDTQVRQARPKEKEYKLSDERGLLLVVRPNGCKWWRLRYKFQGKENMISLGVYPDVSLSMARERRDAARRLRAEGKDPSAERQAEKQAQKAVGQNTFEVIGRGYLARLALKVRKKKGSIEGYVRSAQKSRRAAPFLSSRRYAGNKSLLLFAMCGALTPLGEPFDYPQFPLIRMELRAGVDSLIEACDTQLRYGCGAELRAWGRRSRVARQAVDRAIRDGWSAKSKDVSLPTSG